MKEECNWLKRSIAKFRKNSFRELDEEFLRKFNFLDLRRVCWDQKKYEWMTASYRKNSLYPENLKYATNWGIKMRSKSERTIGNKLEEYGVAYRYDSLVDLDLATVLERKVIRNTIKIMLEKLRFTMMRDFWSTAI